MASTKSHVLSHLFPIMRGWLSRFCHWHVNYNELREPVRSFDKKEEEEESLFANKACVEKEGLLLYKA